jgi:hypothetical protein
MKMNKKILAVVVLLYALTWAGGWITHAREIRYRARQMYANAQEHDRRMAERFQKEGFGPYDEGSRLSKHGPSAEVSWCIPLLPGVLLADSQYVIGPLWGKGGVKIIFYYGSGAKELVFLWGWIS